MVKNAVFRLLINFFSHRDNLNVFFSQYFYAVHHSDNILWISLWISCTIHSQLCTKIVQDGRTINVAATKRSEIREWGKTRLRVCGFLSLFVSQFYSIYSFCSNGYKYITERRCLHRFAKFPTFQNLH